MYSIGDREIAAVARVITNRNLFRYLDDAKETISFESELAAKIGVKHAISVNSGTSALICALAGMGIGPGDEVIIPAYTFMASAVAVLAVGAIPVIAEIDETLTMDVKDVATKVSGRTRAVMPVHIAGFPADMHGLTALAAAKGFEIIEDACQAVGGSYRGGRLGSIGKAGAFSFNHHKIITCGEGGAVLTDDETVYQRAFIQHDSGVSFRPFSKKLGVPIFAGFNFRTNEILSAILRVQLERMDSIVDAVRSQKRYMVERLRGHKTVGLVASHDSEGDCGIITGLTFASSDQAKRFEDRAQKAGMDCYRPIDLERHVYSHWDVVLNHRGGHHPLRNPYSLRENQQCSMDYSADMCPAALDYLARAVFIQNFPGETKEDFDDKLRIVEDSASGI